MVSSLLHCLRRSALCVLRVPMGYVELLKRARRQEVTNEWCRTKYKSVAAHAILSLQRLWLLAGFLAVLTLLMPMHVYPAGQGQPPLEVTCNADNPDRLEFTRHGSGSDQVASSEVVFGVWDSFPSYGDERIGLHVVQHPLTASEQGGHVDRATWLADHDWMKIDFGTEIDSKDSRTYLSIIDPKNETGESIGGPSELNWIELGYQQNRVLYPCRRNPFSAIVGRVDIIELNSPRFEERVDGDVKQWVLRKKEVFVLTSLLRFYVCPGELQVVLVPSTEACTQRPWRIDKVSVKLESRYRVPLEMATFDLGLDAFYLEDPYLSRLAELRLNDRIEAEYERLKKLPPSVPVVSKLIGVLVALTFPYIVAGILACLVRCFGVRRTRRPFRDVYATSAHFLISLTVLSVACEMIILPMFGHSTLVSFVASLLMMSYLFFVLRFWCIYLPLQLTVASGQDVNWQARSLIFGFRKSCCFYSNFYRLICVALVCGAAFLNIQNLDAWVMLDVLPRIMP